MLKVGILAGGKGKRIGGNKPLKVLGNKPMVYWVVQTLKKLSVPIYISVKDNSQAIKIKRELINNGIKEREFIFIYDKYPEISGPISGIVSLLECTMQDNGIFLISAVDQPLINIQFISYLLDLSNIFCHKFVIVNKTREKIHPFPGIYPFYLKNLVEHFLNKCKKRSLYRFFMKLKDKNSILFLNESNPNISIKNLININTLETLRMVEDVFTRA